MRRERLGRRSAPARSGRAVAPGRAHSRLPVGAGVLMAVVARCAQREIVSDIELIPIEKINEAYDRMVRGDVRCRFVIDLKTL